MSTFKLVMVASLIAVTVVAGNAQSGPIQPGVRGGVYLDDGDFMIGADVKLGVLMIDLVPNFEWIFIDGGDLFAFNADGQFTFLPLGIGGVYGGAGVGALRVSPDVGGSKTDAAFNLLAGIGFNFAIDAWAQFKFIISDNNQGVVEAGIRF